MKKKTIIEIISALFILLFVYTAMSKLYAFESFKSVLGESPLIAAYSGVIAWLLPITELIVATLLFMPITRMGGLYAALGLMVLFTTYIGYMIVFTPHLPCSCGGVISKMSWRQHLIFNIFFISLSILGIKTRRNPEEKLFGSKRHPVSVPSN